MRRSTYFLPLTCYDSVIDCSSVKHLEQHGLFIAQSHCDWIKLNCGADKLKVQGDIMVCYHNSLTSLSLK